MQNEKIRELLNQAIESQASNDFEKAEEFCYEILSLDSVDINALHLLGIIEYQKGNFEKAEEFLKRVISLNSNIALFHGNLAMIYDKMEREEDSIKSFEKALEIDENYPNSWMAYYNLGISYSHKNDFEKALDYYDKAIKLNPQFYDAYFNKGISLLTLGDFEKGWNFFEYRFKKSNPTDSRIFNKPEWKGENLSEKRILVLWEQGFGDVIQFVRYLRLLKEKGAYVILECKKELKKLLEQLDIDEFIERKKDSNFSNINFDFYVYIMSLPGLFKTNLGNIPCDVPYLKADKNLVDVFGRFFKEFEDKLKIGIVWHGNPKHENDKNRSSSFECFKRLKNISNVKLFSLQKENGLPDSEKDIVDLRNELKDFSDAAAIIENLDLVITVDTSIAHLAGALGKKVFLLVPFNPEWRWMLNREDTPWYRNMKLFRQKKPKDWGGVMEEVEKEVRRISY